MDYERKINLKFKMWAHFYDGVVLGLLRISGRCNPLVTLVSLMPEKPLQILDVCTGTAIPALAVSQARPQSKVIGIDLSTDMIAVANSKLKNNKAQNLPVVHMDATKMDFMDEEFDAVMVSFDLHEFPEPLIASVLEEMVRVLKSGGTLYITDYDNNIPSGKWPRFAFWLYLKIFEPKHIPWFLSINWYSVLDKIDLTVCEIYHCYFSKVIVALKR
jgi:ubiquinone/menaquinone biosynthesis C-methylase UbiE